MSDDIFAALDEFDYLPPAKSQPQSRITGGEGEQGELTTAEHVVQFVKAGHAIITLQSNKTGTRFTFKITKPEESKYGVSFFVGLLNGPDNTSNYTYIGVIKGSQAGERFALTAKSKITRDAPSYKAFEYFWRAVVAQRRLPDTWGLRVFHVGKCGRCGRALTVPESVMSGFGPECIHKI